MVGERKKKGLVKDDLDWVLISILKERAPNSVEQLVDFVKTETSIAEAEIINRLLRLQAAGRITLHSQPTPSPNRFAAYLKAKEAYWYWITLILAVASALVVLAVPDNAYPLVYLRYGFGLILVLWLPGYAFAKALFPQKSHEKGLDFAERAGLSICLSLALVPIVGLLLNYTPWGVRLTPVTLSLVIPTALLATIAVARDYRNSLE